MPLIGPANEPARVYALDDHGPRTLRDFSPEQEAKKLLTNARAVLANLVPWGWPEHYPERPEDLTAEDRELATIARKLERGDKIAKEDQDQLDLLGQWSAAVRRLESLGCSRLRVLLGVIYTFDSAEMTEEAYQVRMHVWECFKANVPLPCWPRHYRESRLFAEHYSRNFQVFPDWLRRGVDPPEGKGYARIKPPQRGFHYAGDE